MTHYAGLDDLANGEQLEVIGTTVEAGLQVILNVADARAADALLERLVAKGYKCKEVSRCSGPRGTVTLRIAKK